MTTPTLLETMRARDGQIALWPLHRARLLRSASAWSIRVEEAELAEVLGAVLQPPPSDEARIRLTVTPDGRPHAARSPLGPVPFRLVDVDRVPFTEAGGPLCVHKTTSREHYEARYRSARVRGVDETILIRDDGRVVEGTRTTVWVERGGRLLTPPLSAGGLPGVMRAHLLAQGEGEEAELTVENLVAADSIWLSNAVVGRVPVRLIA